MLIWEAVLQKVEKGSNNLAYLVRDVRLAIDPEARTRAERALAVSYALEIGAKGRDIELQITPEESDALCAVASTGRYEERPRADQRAETQALRERNESIFSEEAATWKARR